MASSAAEMGLVSERPAHQDSENPGGLGHIPALDGIRGLAILLVLVDHLFWANSVTGSFFFDVLSAVRESTYIGVNLFFALSGFLITGILLDTLRSPHFFRTFYARRALRIFPLYYGVLILLLVFQRPLDIQWNGWQYFYLTYLANLGFWKQHGLATGRININHFWSLQVEEQFYFVWPLLIYRIRKVERLITWSLIACGIVLLVRIGLVASREHIHNLYLVYSATYSCVDSILFGCCLSLLLRTSMRKRVMLAAPWVAGFCATALLWLALLNHGLRWQFSLTVPTLGFSLLGVLSASLIAMALKTGSRTQGFFSKAFLRFLGKYSYGLYVFHPTIAAFLNAPLRTFVDGHFHNKALGVFVGGLIVGVVSVGVAWLSYHVYEVHFLRLKRYFHYFGRSSQKEVGPFGSAGR